MSRRAFAKRPWSAVCYLSVATLAVGCGGGGTPSGSGLPTGPTGPTGGPPVLINGVENGTRWLFTLDVNSASAGSVGNTGATDLQALAYDATGATLYAVDAASPNSDQLLAIDPARGVGTAVGAIGFGGTTTGTAVRGLAFAPPSTLYGVVDGSFQLITIDTTTGAGTLVGGLGGAAGSILSLAFDPSSNTLYGTSGTELFTINTTSGAATVVGTTGVRIDGLAIEATSRMLYGTGSGILYGIDKATGATGPIGMVTPPGTWTGLAPR
ncbi:hypothetical protein ACFL59_15890 [Planctomycetota bacterium]